MSEHSPKIIIARRDYARLERLAANALRKRHPVGGFLMSEIGRAVVCDAYKVPRGVVRLNEWVTYRIDGNKRTESKILVCPEEFRSAELNLSVLSPLGAAVLGMRVGNCMKYYSAGGRPHFVTVEGVVAPAEAPLMFPLKALCAAIDVPTEPNDDGPKAAG